MLTTVIDRVQQSKAAAGLQEALLAGKTRVALTGVSGSLDALLIGGLAGTMQGQTLVLVPGREAGERLRDDLGLLRPPSEVAMLDQGEGTIRALRLLSSGDSATVIADPKALVAIFPRPDAVREQTFALRRGGEYAPGRLMERLNGLGFVQKDYVEAAGDFAVRGGILDVYPFASDNPLRLEFFGDTVESLREFEPLSQRSIRELELATIVPDLVGSARSAVMAESATLVDYLHPDALIILIEPEAITGGIQELGSGASESGSVGLKDLSPFERWTQVSIENISPPAGAIDVGGRPQPAFNGSMAVLRRTLAEYEQSGYTVILCSDGQGELGRLKDLIAAGGEGETGEENVTFSVARLAFLTPSLHEGFVLASEGLVVLTEHQMFNRLKRRGKRRGPKFRGLSEREVQQLRAGDFVVHQDYGIGRYEGLRRIRVNNAEQEVIAVQYEENDRLYVNLHYINKLQKYSSNEGHVPKLTKLGTAEWDRLKARAKKRVKDIARDLIHLYARRKALPGHAYPEDTPWQKELEASFMYEDTFDQAKATREVKGDMEAPWPMDRLICGDVGFGKTEVAVRAAFKAVLDGRQVAVLVPTTILALQHYNTFMDRTGRYGVRTAMLSRFRTKKGQAEVLAALVAGGVDVVVGTHRLLSKDVAFKNLGLLIVDEEHRFGVAAKEKLRTLRVTVDTLTLTATPIPRTLHFSLLGARDLSIIATAPRNRRPVITEILQWNDDVIREAVHREIGRGGQVFFVHDRIQTLQYVVDRLRGLFPTLRIRNAHGEMPGHELEEVMLEFMEKRCDILVSTKIVESGLDIPNVNTMFIDRADRFGLAELYQLRGRVGRSNVQAYAYLLTPPISSLPQVTLRRLQAIEEFTELGSGFNLAMRDMEIRGTGNLLGSEQSGFITTMGFETYVKVLEEAVRELKEQDFADLFRDELAASPTAADTIVEPEFDALIPQDYIRNDAERLAVYRRLYKLATEEQLDEVAEELRDRFGPLPQETRNLIETIRVRLFASRYRLKRVRIGMEITEVEFPPETDKEFYEGEHFQEIMRRIGELRGRGARLVQEESSLRLRMKGKSSADGSEVARGALKLLSDLLTLNQH
jgi:transcription-repair coupling factor (superfamily II helicase)